MSEEEEFEAFGEGEDWQLNAIVGPHHWSSSEMAYIWGYESAVGSLTAVAKFVAAGEGQPYPGTDVMIDTIVYPQVFCARHFLELSLKCLLRRVAAIAARNANVPVPSTHDLSKLFMALLKSARQHAPEVLPFVEKINPMVSTLSQFDRDGDAFRYSVSKGDAPHLAGIDRINIERFQKWFDQHRWHVHQAFYAIGYELDELDKGGSTKHYKRDDLADLAGRLPKRDAWNGEILRRFYEEELSTRPEMSYTQFQAALRQIMSLPWLALKVGRESPLPEVRDDLFGRLLAPDRRDDITQEEWGALYCIFRVGAGEIPEEYQNLMRGAQLTAIEYQKWQEDIEKRRRTMTEGEIEAERDQAFADGTLSFDTSRMAIFDSEGKIRALLPERAYIFCRGLEKLGQPTLLGRFQQACDVAGISWSEPQPSDALIKNNWPRFPNNPESKEHKF